MGRRLTPQQLVRRLRERGWTASAIGRAVGRDSSQVSAIASGRTRGTNLEEAFRDLLERKGRPPRRGEPVSPARSAPGRRQARVRPRARVTPRGLRQQTFRPPQGPRGPMARFLRAAAFVEFVADVTYVTPRGSSYRGEVHYTDRSSSIRPEYILEHGPSAWESLRLFLNEIQAGRRGSGPSDAYVERVHSVVMTRGDRHGAGA